MDSIIAHVSDENKEWVSSLEPADVARILNAMALVPSIVENFPNADFVLPDEKASEYSDTAAVKGLQGENEFEDMCKNLLSSQFSLINTAKKSKSGDFFIEWKSPETGQIYKYLIDIKNYKSTVPSKEVDKFYRDIELHSSLDGAILISLHSKIVGKKSVFHYETRLFNTNEVPIAYVCSNEPTVISEIIKFMASLSEVRQTCGINMSGSEKVMRSIKDLESSIDLFSRSRGNLQDIKLMLEKQFNKIFIDLLSVEHVFRDKIKAITQSLLETSREQKNESESAPLHEISHSSLRDSNVEHESPVSIKPPLLEIKSEPVDIIESINKDCKNYVSNEQNDNMLRNIWENGDWDTGDINSSDNEWTVSRTRDDTSIVFSFQKKHINVLIPKVKSNFSEIIQNKKIGKITRKGYTVKLNIDSYEVICQICNIKI